SAESVPYHALLTLPTRPPPRTTLFPYTTLFRSHTTRRTAVCEHQPSDSAAYARRLRRHRRPGRHRGFRLREAGAVRRAGWRGPRSEEHTSELQSRENLVCRLLLEKKKYSVKRKE